MTTQDPTNDAAELGYVMPSNVVAFFSTPSISGLSPDARRTVKEPLRIDKNIGQSEVADGLCLFFASGSCSQDLHVALSNRPYRTLPHCACVAQ